jgi:hypothetical protein
MGLTDGPSLRFTESSQDPAKTGTRRQAPSPVEDDASKARNAPVAVSYRIRKVLEYLVGTGSGTAGSPDGSDGGRSAGTMKRGSPIRDEVDRSRRGLDVLRGRYREVRNDGRRAGRRSRQGAHRTVVPGFATVVLVDADGEAAAQEQKQRGDRNQAPRGPRAPDQPRKHGRHVRDPSPDTSRSQWSRP